jgi:preprotein translocase subunit SecA
VKSPVVREILYDVLYEVISAHTEEMVKDVKEEGVRAFVEWIHSIFPIPLKTEELPSKSNSLEPIIEMVFERVQRAYEVKLQIENPQTIDLLERHVMLQAIDTYWQDYLRAMDNLRQGVGLRAYGQRDPLVEYKREAFEMFASLMNNIHQDIASKIFRSATTLMSVETYMRPVAQKLVHEEVAILGRGATGTVSGGGEGSAGGQGGAAMEAAMRSVAIPVRRDTPKVGRNDPCPCGSGKKFKKCCGAGGG